MKSGVPTGPDAALVRAAARRIGLQISIACALVVVIVALITLVVGPLLHPVHPPRLESGGDDDALLRDALLIAGAIGVVIAGLVGFVAARRAVAPLGEALALQRRFIADAGHELRTPLTALHTRAQLVARRMNPNDPSRAVVDQLLADSRMLGEVIDELLESAALAADPSDGEILDPGELAGGVVASMSVLAESKGVALLWVGGEGSLQVRVSRSALRRAVSALVDNALSHAPRGGHVTVTTADSGNDVLITVSDDGDGLAGDDAIRLTQRFARGEAAINGVGGRRFGLGLSLVREIAAAQGGTFTLTGSSPGAQATIRLPGIRVPRVD